MMIVSANRIDSVLLNNNYETVEYGDKSVLANKYPNASMNLDLHFQSVDVLSTRDPEFQLLIKKFITKCQSANQSSPVVQFRREFIKSFKDKDGKETRRWVRQYDILYSIPKVGNFNVVAVIDHTLGEDSNLTYAKSGFEVPGWAKTKQTCDHCQTKRDRRKTVLLKNTQDEVIQVGLSCLKAYTGDDPGSTFRALGFEQEISQFGCGISWNANSIDTNLVVELSCASIRQFGYVSRAAADAENGVEPTSTRVRHTIGLMALTNPSAEQREELTNSSPNDEDRKFAAEAMEWAREQDGKSEFECNLRAVASTALVGYQHLGFACCIPRSYTLFLEKQRKIIADAANKPQSEFVGSIGDRITNTMTVQLKKNVDSMFGTSILWRFTDECGNVYSTFASGRPLMFKNNEVKIGDTIEIKGTVKEHVEFQGRKETRLTRVVTV